MKRYVNRCDLYQRIKNHTKVLVGKLIVDEVPEKLWMYLIVDFIMKLLLVVEKNAILVVCDKLFNMVHFIVTTKEMSVEGLARLLRNNIQKLYRLPESVISN